MHMKETIIRPTDPFSSILANDGQVLQNEKILDNVWELQFDSGEIGGLSLYSTLGLQAISTRITPLFSNMNENIIKISQYYVEPAIEEILPNYARIISTPFKNISARFEYFIHDANSILGKISIQNENPEDFFGFLSYLVALKPFPGGEQMKGNHQSHNFFLTGKTNDLDAVFYMDGNSQPGKFGQSSIERSIAIKSGETHHFHWFFVFDKERPDVLQLNNKYQEMTFDKEVAKILLQNQTQLFQVYTGNRAWDQTIHASQISASQLLIRNPETNTISLIQNRFPEKSIFSEEESKTWITEGISPIQFWYFQQAIPNQYKIFKQVFEDWINLQKSDGFIPNNNNPVSFQSRYHAFPILFKIASEILNNQEDTSLAKIYIDKLIPYLEYWLSNENMDHIPRWENAMQSLYEDFPIHNLWGESSAGVNPKWIDSPFLKSLLISECDLCITISTRFKIEHQQLDSIKKQRKILFEDLIGSWDNKQKLFPYRDIQTKKTPIKKIIFKTKGSGIHNITEELKYSQRISVMISSKKDLTKNITLEIEGEIGSQSIRESIKPRDVHWAVNNGLATTAYIFDRISKIQIINLPAESTIEFSTSKFNLKDLSLITPICIPGLEKKHLDSLVNHWLKSEFDTSFGFSQLPKNKSHSKTSPQNQIDLPMNTFLLISLVNQGYSSFAKLVFTKLMNNVVKNLRTSKKFYKLFDANNGNCIGEYNIINGMVPLKLFFNLCGILHWSDEEIIFFGANQFANDVIIYHRGLKVICSRKIHKLISSGGAEIEVDTKNFNKVKIPT